MNPQRVRVDGLPTADDLREFFKSTVGTPSASALLRIVTAPSLLIPSFRDLVLEIFMEVYRDADQCETDLVDTLLESLVDPERPRS